MIKLLINNEFETIYKEAIVTKFNALLIQNLAGELSKLV